MSTALGWARAAETASSEPDCSAVGLATYAGSRAWKRRSVGFFSWNTCSRNRRQRCQEQRISSSQILQPGAEIRQIKRVRPSLGQLDDAVLGCHAHSLFPSPAGGSPGQHNREGHLISSRATQRNSDYFLPATADRLCLSLTGMIDGTRTVDWAGRHTPISSHQTA